MSEPVKYAPQYGGYCAGEVAITDSVNVNIDPEVFKIIDGKLYLIYDQGGAEYFADHANEIVPKGDANWPKAVADLNMDPYHWDPPNSQHYFTIEK